MKKKKIILSYDYELFFGDKSGTVKKTLIEPTNLILEGELFCRMADAQVSEKSEYRKN